jgi:hypothetical protein
MTRGFFFAQLSQPSEEWIEFLRIAAAVHPAVSASGATKCCVGMSPDQDPGSVP